MRKLPLWVLNNDRPSVYDSESATAIEMVAKIYGAMQEFVDEYNNFATNVNEEIESFVESSNGDYETFKVAIRQEFQDFIDVINVKVLGQDDKIAGAVSYMKSKIIETAEGVVDELIEKKSSIIDGKFDTVNMRFDLVNEKIEELKDRDTFLLQQDSTNRQELSVTIGGLSDRLGETIDKVADHETYLTRLNGFIAENDSDIGTLRARINNIVNYLKNNDSTFEDIGGNG